MKAIKAGTIKNVSYFLAILTAVACSLFGARTPAWAEEAVRTKEKARAVKVLLNDLIDGNPQGLTEDQIYILDQAAEVLNNYSTTTVEATDATIIQQPKQPNAMLTTEVTRSQPIQANAMAKSFRAQPLQANAMLKLQPQQANAMLNGK